MNDDDGGSSSATSDGAVTVIDAALFEPAPSDGIAIGRSGRALPLKVHVGCGATNLPGLAPEVWIGDTFAGRMREQDGFYRFNLRVDGSRMIRIAPFGVAGGTIDVPVRVPIAATLHIRDLMRGSGWRGRM